MLQRRFAVAIPLLSAALFVACKPQKKTPPAAPDAAPVTTAHDAAAAKEPARPAEAGQDAAPEAKEPRPVAKTYKTVVQLGDSMVGGGLCKALAPKFKAEGTKFVRDVVESTSIPAFDESDRVPTLMKRYDPDLVLVTLGANDVFNDHPEYETKHIESIVKKIGHRDCVWIGPPLWKGDRGLVKVLAEHVAPCRFYDSQYLTLQRAGDGIHPTEKGGQVWADAFWPFFKGEVDAGL